MPSVVAVMPSCLPLFGLSPHLFFGSNAGGDPDGKSQPRGDARKTLQFGGRRSPRTTCCFRCSAIAWNCRRALGQVECSCVEDGRRNKLGMLIKCGILCVGGCKAKMESFDKLNTQISLWQGVLMLASYRTDWSSRYHIAKWGALTLFDHGSYELSRSFELGSCLESGPPGYCDKHVDSSWHVARSLGNLQRPHELSRAVTEISRQLANARQSSQQLIRSDQNPGCGVPYEASRHDRLRASRRKLHTCDFAKSCTLRPSPAFSP